MAKKSGKKTTDVVIVQSKMKDYLRSKGFNVSSDVIEHLNMRVHHLMDEAATRTKSNGRKTVRGADF